MIKYAPYIDGTIPAFTADGGIKVPFQPNLAVGEGAAAGMVLMVKDLNGNILEYKESTRVENNMAEFTVSSLITLEFNEYTAFQGGVQVIIGLTQGEYIINKIGTNSITIINNENKELIYSIFPKDKNLIPNITVGDNVEIKNDDITITHSLDLEIGQYYKIQLAYKDKDIAAENYSKLVYSSVGVTKYIGVVSHYFNEEDNSFRFECEDPTETIFKNEEKVFLDNVEINNQTLLRNGFTYTRINVVTTINNYVSKSEYIFTKHENTPSNLPNIKISKNYEYGEIILPPLDDSTLKYIRVNSIYDKNYSLVSSLDNTVEHGKNYYYGIINNNGDWLLNTTDSIVPYFEDMFLQDATHSLRIKFNPKVSSFKKTIQESKVDTLGGQYPYFFRNGDMNYAEFPISGLLTYWMGDSGKFGYDWEYGIIKHFEGRRGEDATIVVSQNLSVLEANFNDNGTLMVEDGIRPGRTTNLVNYNIAAEREYKMKVLEWLNNGQPKLFRSPTEGNFVVRLMNVSLSPEERLGRMLHSFSCTAYECAAADYETLVSLHLVPGSEAEK